MDTLKTDIIVGGGLSGLMTAKLLVENSKEFSGLEQDECLGGRAFVGHHRFYEKSAVDFLGEQISHLDWAVIQEPGAVRKKNAWEQIDNGLSPEEDFYLGHTFFAPKHPLSESLAPILDLVGSRFETRKKVVSIFPEEKRIECSDESSYYYERLFWCSDLAALNRVWRGSQGVLPKNLRVIKPAPGGINWDIEVEGSIFDQRNTMVVPFKYKGTSLRALGTQSTENDRTLLRWITFVPPAIMEDREETAKCVRALKREIKKEFSQLSEKTVRETLAFLPSISGDSSAHRETLELVDGVYYVGPQIHLVEAENPPQNLDLILNNVHWLRDHLSATPG